MKKKKILFDLNTAHKSCGLSGISQETRFLFDIFSHSKNFEIDGLIYSSKRFSQKFKNLNDLVSQSILLGFGLSEEKIPSHPNPLVQLFMRKLPTLFKIFSTLQEFKYQRFKTVPLHKNLDFAQIWRLFFQSTLPFEEWDLLSKNRYLLTNLSLSRLHSTFLSPHLNTKGYDFAVFSYLRSLKLSPGTTPIIRYHDGIPLFQSDTVISSRSASIHSNLIKHHERTSIFVCNSPSSLTDLEKISPIAAKKACVIPCIIPKMNRVETSRTILLRILQQFASPFSLEASKNGDPINSWLGKSESVPKFILTLSSIEPRKNHLGLINAWENLKFHSNDAPKILIVGSPGWNYDPILVAMKPLIASGDLLHLEKVSQDYLPYLYSAAACFVFPSFGEGFGLPPCEAMQCECPLALSDIPAHRYIAEDAALYFSPYDKIGMSHALKTLTSADRNSPFIKDLTEKGLKSVKRFKKSEILSQWESLFDSFSKSSR